VSHLTDRASPSDGFWDSLLREIPLLPPTDHTSWPKDSLHPILQLLPHTPTWRIHPPDSCPSVLGTCLGLACALTCSTCTRYLPGLSMCPDMQYLHSALTCSTCTRYLGVAKEIHFRLKPLLRDFFRDLDVTRRYTLKPFLDEL
jgi:hypothetical protein